MRISVHRNVMKSHANDEGLGIMEASKSYPLYGLLPFVAVAKSALLFLDMLMSLAFDVSKIANVASKNIACLRDIVQE